MELILAPINWEAVQAVATVTLVATSLGATGYAGLQLKHEREFRSVANLEKQLACLLGNTFAASRRRLAETRPRHTRRQRSQPMQRTAA